MDGKFLGYETLSSHDYGKYYLRIYDTYNKENNPINFGDKLLISISNTKYDPKNPNSYKDELVEIIGMKDTGKTLTGSFVNTAGNTTEYRSGSIILHLENIKEVIIPIDGSKNKIDYTPLYDISFGPYYLINYNKYNPINNPPKNKEQVLISYARENPNDLKSYKDVWVELGTINIDDGTYSATFVSENKYENGVIRVYDKNFKDIR